MKAGNAGRPSGEAAATIDTLRPIRYSMRGGRTLVYVPVQNRSATPHYAVFQFDTRSGKIVAVSQEFRAY